MLLHGNVRRHLYLCECCVLQVEKYEVYGLPTLILFKDGEKVEGSHLEGAINKDKLGIHLTKFGIDK